MSEHHAQPSSADSSEGGQGTLFVISAPSGAGKSTLIARLMEVLPGLAFSVSWTTRSPREGERDGEAYHFVDRPEFERKVEAGDFLEWAEVHSHLYGTARAQVDAIEQTGQDVILDIDVQGARQVRESGHGQVSIFILPPGSQLLRERLEGRGTETEQTLRRRLRNARDEMQHLRVFDFLVINDDLERAADELITIVRAERLRRPRQMSAALAILRSFEEE